MKKLIFITLLVAGCSGYNQKMNDLLVKKKAAEDSLFALQIAIGKLEKPLPLPPQVGFTDSNEKTKKDTSGEFANEIARIRAEDLLRSEISIIRYSINKIEYSIDSLSKLK